VTLGPPPNDTWEEDTILVIPAGASQGRHYHQGKVAKATSPDTVIDQDQFYFWVTDTLGAYQTGADGQSGVLHFLMDMEEILGDSEYKETYQKGFKWLMEMAIPGYDPVWGQWYKWFIGTDSSLWHNARANANIGHAFLRASQLTGNSTYLDYAKKAANYLYSIHLPCPYGDGYAWHPSDYDPRIGLGSEYFIPDFFKALYEADPNDPLPLQFLKGYMTCLKNRAREDTSSNGYGWWHNSEDTTRFCVTRCYGTTQAIQDFYNFYKLTGDSAEDIAYGNGGLRWLISKAEPEDGGYKWNWKYPRDNTIPPPDTTYAPTWGRGSAGIGLVFLKGYELNKDTDPAFAETCSTYARGAMTWVDSIAKDSLGGYTWTQSIANGDTGDFLTGGCQGTPGIAMIYSIFSRKLKDDPEDTSYARGGVNWIDAMKIVISETKPIYTWVRGNEEGYWKDKIDVGNAFGVSGLGRALLILADTLNQGETYELAKKLAKGAANWLEYKKEMQLTGSCCWRRWYYPSSSLGVGGRGGKSQPRLDTHIRKFLKNKEKNLPHTRKAIKFTR